MFWVNLFVSFTYHFRTPVFQHGTSLVIIITILIIISIIIIVVVIIIIAIIIIFIVIRIIIFFLLLPQHLMFEVTPSDAHYLKSHNYLKSQSYRSRKTDTHEYVNNIL